MPPPAAPGSATFCGVIIRSGRAARRSPAAHSGIAGPGWGNGSARAVATARPPVARACWSTVHPAQRLTVGWRSCAGVRPRRGAPGRIIHLHEPQIHIRRAGQGGGHGLHPRCIRGRQQHLSRALVDANGIGLSPTLGENDGHRQDGRARPAPHRFPWPGPPTRWAGWPGRRQPTGPVSPRPRLPDPPACSSWLRPPCLEGGHHLRQPQLGEHGRWGWLQERDTHFPHLAPQTHHGFPAWQGHEPFRSQQRAPRAG